MGCYFISLATPQSLKNIPKMDAKRLKEASHHLYYEWWMLEESAKIAPRNQVEVNAKIESFCLHARNLLEFLYDNGGDEDSFRAIDFFDNKSGYLSRIKAKYPVPHKILTRLNKELTHLTYSRIRGSPPEKVWYFADVIHNIAGPVHEFLRMCPSELLDPELISIKNLLVRDKP